MMALRAAPPSFYDRLIGRLRDGVPFAFSRWGDGEWACLLGHAGATCDGQPYSGRLRADLTRVLASGPAYDLGMQAFAQRRFGAEIAAWLERRGLSSLPWVDADVLARQSRDGGLDQLFAALRAREVILVGPAHLAPLARLIPLVGHVTVPAADAYRMMGITITDASAVASQCSAPVVVVSAGPLAKLVVHDLHARLRGVTVVDTGSLWEPYVGRATRTYHRAVLAREAGAA
jgi:hypothetical protein